MEQLLCCRGRLWGCWVDAINTVGNTMSMHSSKQKHAQSMRSKSATRVVPAAKTPIKQTKDAEGQLFKQRFVAGHSSSYTSREPTNVFKIDELMQELLAPQSGALNLVDYFNVNPGLTPLSVGSAPASGAANLIPGLGPAAYLSQGSEISNAIGFCARTAAQAVCYDKWRNMRLKVRYEPEVSGFAAAGAVGEIILHFEPNVVAGPASDVPTLLRSRYVAAGRLCDTVELDLPAAFAKKWYFLRNGPVAWGSSIADYDGGRVTVWVNGIQASAYSTLMGRLWVRGTVEMFDDISPGEATSLQPYAPQSIILGMQLLPTTSGSSSTNFYNLINNSDLIGTSPGTGGYYNSPFSSVNLPPGNYGIEIYANPTFTSATTGIGTATGIVYCVVSCSNLADSLSSGNTTVLADNLTTTLTQVGAVSQTIVQQRPITFRSFFSVKGNGPGVLTTSITWSTADTGLGSSSVSWGEVNNAYANTIVLATGLGAVVRIFRT